MTPQKGDTVEALAAKWEAEAARYRIAEPVHFRGLAAVAESHASQIRRALTPEAQVANLPTDVIVAEARRRGCRVISTPPATWKPPADGEA